MLCSASSSMAALLLLFSRKAVQSVLIELIVGVVHHWGWHRRWRWHPRWRRSVRTLPCQKVLLSLLLLSRCHYLCPYSQWSLFLLIFLQHQFFCTSSIVVIFCICLFFAPTCCCKKKHLNHVRARYAKKNWHAKKDQKKTRSQNSSLVTESSKNYLWKTVPPEQNMPCLWGLEEVWRTYPIVLWEGYWRTI